ncbi:hypothetical protein OR16_36112 [Cupriavidus basilensis OR16]|uniref:Transmembrane protein n=1 Tax=Cupriavidus basilensis OR16 TaxID=1127483 RepID=H1SFT8_9BURK|nr:hypothetical protein [Cupriavidus basilensis]EHP38660.1 hypothetical protein OR16_36112 [Cupriavidus basilensis OR16]
MQDSLAALRAEAVRAHLAAIEPGQAREKARALRRERKRGLSAGALGGGLAVLAAWFVTAAFIGDGQQPAAALASAPAVMPASAEPRKAPADGGMQEAAEVSLAVAVPPAPMASLDPRLPEDAAAVAAMRPDDARPVSPPVTAAAGRGGKHHSAGAPALVAQRVVHALPHRPAEPAAAPASGMPAHAEAAWAVAYDAPDAAYLRPSAVAYLPHDSRIELHAHTRLTGD